MRPWIHWCAAGLALTTVFLLSAAVDSTQAGTTVVDANGRQVEVPDASRIVAIGGDITEILYALGVQSRLVAVDSTSQFPPEALKQKANVGYMRALSTEGVLSVGATLILASDRAGPPEVVNALKQTAVPYVEVPDGLSPEGVLEKVRLVARAVEMTDAGDALVRRLENEFASLARQRARIRRPVRALFVLNAQGGRATVGGSATSADAILRLAGAENAASAVNGFKPIVDEALVEMMPDVIVTMQRAGGGHETAQLQTMRGITATPAGAAQRIFTMDGLYLLGFGPRTPAAALQLMHVLYPEIAPSGSTQ